VTISYISAASAAATSVTLGTHATNDLITILAFNNTSATTPSLPTGWVNQYTLTATIGWRVGYKIAASSSETSGTWTNADGVIALVHRASAGALVLPATNVSSSGTATNITYGAIGTALDRTNAADRWMITLASTRTADSSVETAPSSFTNRTSLLGGSWEIAAHDSNGALGSYGGGTVSAGGTSALFRTLIIQLFETAYTASGGGGGFGFQRSGMTGGFGN
jgi:hypothetical protein